MDTEPHLSRDSGHISDRTPAQSSTQAPVNVEALEYNGSGYHIRHYAFRDMPKSRALAVLTIREERNDHSVYYVALGCTVEDPDGKIKEFPTSTDDIVAACRLPRDLKSDEHGFLGPLTVGEANVLHELAEMEAIRRHAAREVMFIAAKFAEKRYDPLWAVHDWLERAKSRQAPPSP